MSNLCFNLNNTIDISNYSHPDICDVYVFNNETSILGSNGKAYGLFETSGTIIYSIQNIPKNNPMGFYDASGVSEIVDITSCITYGPSYEEPIKIYVSKGSDLSFINSDYFRFYDESFNLLNISGSTIDTALTNSGDNFYFMRNMSYKFIAIDDFSTNHPFSLSGDALTGNYNDDLSLTKIDDSFNILIPKDTNNTTNRIFYTDYSQNDVSGLLNILVDVSNISYYYGDISISVDPSYEHLFDNSYISAKSYPFNGISDISNINIFKYDNTCRYVTQDENDFINILYANNQECLNIVSEAKKSHNVVADMSFYEFNLGNHGRRDVSGDFLYDLDYGVYDGSYTILNIDSNFPITLKNNDISNAIYVDEQNTTGIIQKTDSRIINLGETVNIYNFYYNTVKIIVNNDSNTLTNNHIIKLHVINFQENTHYELPSNLVYTTFCERPDFVNNITYRDLSFLLFNQHDEPFAINDFSNNQNNIYSLNLYQDYVEPAIPYQVVDRYNHNLSNLVTSNIPREITLPDGSILSNKHSINFDLSFFLITYTLKDYEDLEIQLNRLVEIRRGPYIEISGTEEFFDKVFFNSNQYINRIDVSTNKNGTIDPSFNFNNILDVFVYDNSSNKINLPYEITVSGGYYQTGSIYENLIFNYLYSNSKKVLTYDNINISDRPLRIYSDSTGFSRNYYLSKNFDFNYLTDSNTDVNELGIKISNINTINFKNNLNEKITAANYNSSELTSQSNLFHINDTDLNNSIENYILDPQQTISSLFIDSAAGELKINNVNNQLALIDISQAYNDIINNINYRLNTYLTINNEEFNLNIIDTVNSDNNLIIDGSFEDIFFFSPNHIDTRYIGNYELEISVKGLSYEDYIYNDISDIIDFISYKAEDFSRNILINVINDTSDFCFNFINENVINPPPNPLLYEYHFPREFSFNIYSDISFFNQGDFYLENTTMPLLELSHNSIYDGSLNFQVYPVNNITEVFTVNNSVVPNTYSFSIEATNKNADAVADIKYTGFDIMGNKIGDVSLNINFFDIPLLKLKGNRREIVTVHTPYTEPGITMFSSTSNVDYVPTGIFSTPYSNNTTNNPTGYDISYSIVGLDISTVGIYESIFHVNKFGVSQFAEIKRQISIVDILNPFFAFPDLRSLDYIDGSNDAGFVTLKDTKYVINDYHPDNSFNIDFSLSIFSSFDDLSYIINTFEISDNYPPNYPVDLSTIITLSIRGSGDISFNENSLRNVNLINDGNTNTGYLNNDNRFNRVSIGLNKVNPMIFNYKIIDPYDNSFNYSRIVDIVDISFPSIDFSYNPQFETDLSYVQFSSNYKDLSYQALNYTKNYDLLLTELSSIIFDFSLVDNYEVVNNNYIISISGNNFKKENIKNITDIRDNIILLNLFSKVDTSLVIIYDISDNQFNTTSINRIVDIVNLIEPSVNFIQRFNYNNKIYIDFGDNNYNILQDFSLTHSRVLDADLTFDISFIAPSGITTISGHYNYDPEGLIYTVSGDISSVHYDMGFYSISKQLPYDLSSDELKIEVVITNPGPSFNLIPYSNELDSINILHEAGTFFNDASFIMGLNSHSEYDKYFYVNNYSDFSYLYTDFSVNYDNSFNVNKPEIGLYTISYDAFDKNETRTIFNRYILVIDTQPPLITLSNDIITINQFEELIMPTAFFNDIGTDLSRIEIDLSNSGTLRDISNIPNIFFKDINIETYTFSSTQLVLNSVDTSNSMIIYEIIYKAYDRFNNLNEKSQKIIINHTTDFILTPKISISGNNLDLNGYFNNNFYNLINSNTENLSSIFDFSDIKYDSINKTITYEVKKIENFDLLDFSMHSSYINEPIPDYNNTVVNNIVGKILGEYRIIFQSFNDENLESLTETIYFNIVDTTPPDLSYILSGDYSDISNILLPQISKGSYDTLQTNPNFLQNNNLENPFLFTHDTHGNPIFSIPGINITDIMDGSCISLSNETIPPEIDISLSLFITYRKILSTAGYDILPKSFTAINNETEIININPNLLDSTIEVSIGHADINLAGYAFIKFEYIDGTIHEFRHRGNGLRQFYKPSNGTWSTYYGMGNHSSSVRTWTETTSKNYYIYCSEIIGVSTWIFRALDGGLKKVTLEDNASSKGMINVAVIETPIFDISTGYLLFNIGTYEQNYRVFDHNGNFSDISRAITIKSKEPFINLNHTTDDNNNVYLKYYHKQHTGYVDILGRVYDYNLGEITNKRIIITQYINSAVLGVQTVKFELFSYESLTKAEREVHVVDLKCLPFTINSLNELIRNPSSEHYKWGLYNDKYIINIPDPSDAIRVFGYDYINNNTLDISNLIDICGENVISHENNDYHWGRIDLSVNGNFNRANIEYLDSNSSRTIIEDIFLYTEECFQILIDQLLSKPLPRDAFRVDVSGYNDIDNSYQFFTLSGELYPEFQDEKQHYITDLSRANLHLAMGKYKFVQDTEKNFYNRIKFSLTEDGSHNGGIEFTKGITEYGLPGLSGGYTELTLSVTTPSPLYYYSEYFPNMGGKIETRNNLVISSGNIYVNDNVLSVDNSLALQSFNSEETLLNRIYLCQKFDLSGINGNGSCISNVHYNCITQQIINHNVLVNKSKNLIIFKKYQRSPNYDPVASGVVSYVPSYDTINVHSDISNVNLKHDLSNHYLFDVSVNNYQSLIFQYDYTIDTSENILKNLDINTLNENLVVAVGSGNNVIAYSNNEGTSWVGLGNIYNMTVGLGVAYNGLSRFLVVGQGSNDIILYSDNGIDWFSSIGSNSIFSDYAKAVVYDSSNSYWIVGGKGSTNTLAYSIDNGLNWLGLGNSLFNIEVNHISKYNDLHLIASGEDTNNTLGYSSDGINWSPGIDVASGGNTKQLFSIKGNSSVYFNSQNRWIATGSGISNSIAYSNDGINWNGLGTDRISEGRDIDANDNMVIIGGVGTINSSIFSAIIYSYDGLTWYSSGSNIFTECNSIVWSGTRWLATGVGPTHGIAVSINGINWTGITNSIDIFSTAGKYIEGYSRIINLREANELNYETNILDLFYSNGELNNYSHFFRKNRLLNNCRLITDNFISIINELKYVNNVSIIDNNSVLDYYLNKYLSSKKIIFSHILDNFITFNLQTYIDLSNLNINKDLLDILYDEQFSLYESSKNYINTNSNITNVNYRIDMSNLLFDEFVVNIWSDICGQLETIIKTEEQSILLSNSLIELNEYLLDSEDSSGILYNIYRDEINNNGFDYVNNELKEKVFLSLRDSSMISHDYNQYIGLTLQNINHNMYINEEDQLIFHNYEELANNFKVNEPSLTLKKTFTDFSNNKKYLLELSSNDVYGCFVDSSNINIYENSNRKNNIIRQNQSNYKSFIAYFFDNELPNTDIYLNQFDIRPMSVNGVEYNVDSYTNQQFHSHSYLIDLNDYFDRYIYDNSNLEVPWNVYNESNLSYTIKDISYINFFNIFDVKANQNIIYDKSKIEILNYLQNFLIILNFKLDYIYQIINNEIIYNNSLQNLHLSDYEFITNLNIQNLTTLYNNIDVISTNYQLTLANNSLNKLFSNNFYNLNQLKNKYYKLEEIFRFNHNSYLIDLTNNTYDSITNFTNIDQMLTDASSINVNIDNFIYNNLYNFYNRDIIEDLIKAARYSVVEDYSDFDILYRLLRDFYIIREDYDNIIHEFNVRHLNESLFSAVNIIDYSFIDLHDIMSINEFTINLLNNYVSIDQVLKHQVVYSNLYIPTNNHIGTDDLCYNSYDPGFIFTYNQVGVNLLDLSNSINYILNNYNYFLTATSRNYDFINKEKIYDDINYFMSGSKILVNSFQSNNIEVRLDIKYNSYLFPDKYVDTVVLDLAIPDYIPPTLIFNNTDLSLSQAISTITNGNINSLIEVLIKDISFIEINQNYDISSNLTNIVYNDISFNYYESQTVINNVYSTIEIDVRNLYNESTNFIGDDASINIFYTIIDNANNRNTITRTVNVERGFEYPEFFINGITIKEFFESLGGFNWAFTVLQGTIITDEMLLEGLTATDSADGGSGLTITVENTLTNTDIVGVYENVITYTATSNKGVGITTTIKRDIIITSDPTLVDNYEEPYNPYLFGDCPCPVYYKPIQHNHNLGSSASSRMRLARIILNSR